MDNQEMLKRLVDIHDRLGPVRVEFREYMDGAIEGFADHCYGFYHEFYWRRNKSSQTRITRAEWYSLPPDKREPRDVEDVEVPPGGATGRYARTVDFCLNSTFAGLAELIHHVRNMVVEPPPLPALGISVSDAPGIKDKPHG